MELNLLSSQINPPVEASPGKPEGGKIWRPRQDWCQVQDPHPDTTHLPDHWADPSNHGESLSDLRNDVSWHTTYHPSGGCHVGKPARLVGERGKGWYSIFCQGLCWGHDQGVGHKVSQCWHRQRVVCIWTDFAPLLQRQTFQKRNRVLKGKVSFIIFVSFCSIIP